VHAGVRRNLAAVQRHMPELHQPCRLAQLGETEKLTVNEEKTRICRIPEGEFDFLGYTFGRMYSARTGQARLGYRPSKKSIKRIVEKIHALIRACMSDRYPFESVV
jgi:hypothetical protein